jgi:hypothetical protein
LPRIITRAEIHMANEVDAAQKRGELATRHGDNQYSKRVQTSDALSLDLRRVAELAQGGRGNVTLCDRPPESMVTMADPHIR